MKVVHVQARCLKIPIKYPFTETPRTEGMLVVQVETDDSFVGAGISRDAERFAVRELIHHELGPFLLGKDPVETEKMALQPQSPDFSHSPQFSGWEVPVHTDSRLM